jgi:hypothetical protein
VKIMVDHAMKKVHKLYLKTLPPPSL